MTPPLWASVLSLVVALNQPLQHVLGVHMRPIRDAIAQAGDCSIPLTLVVLGAYFHRPPDKSEFPSSEPNGQQQASPVGIFRRIFCLEGWKNDRGTPLQATRARNRGEGRTVFVSILARMVITPALLLPLLVFGQLQGYPRVFRECAPLVANMSNVLISHLHASSPVFILSLVLLLASPPALTLAQVGPLSLVARGCRMFTFAPADHAIYERCIRAPHKPHYFLVLLSHRASRNGGICVDRHVDYETVNLTRLCRVKFYPMLFVGPTSGNCGAMDSYIVAPKKLDELIVNDKTFRTPAFCIY